MLQLSLSKESFIFFLLAILPLALLFVFKQLDPDTITAIHKPPFEVSAKSHKKSNIQESLISNTKLTQFSEQGSISHQITSKALTSYQGDSLMYIEQPAMLLNEQQDKWRFTSNVGQFNKYKNKLTLQKNVTVVRDIENNLLTMRTPELIYFLETGMVTSNKGVIIDSNNHRIESKNLLFDLNSQQYSVSGNVQSLHLISTSKI